MPRNNSQTNGSLNISNNLMMEFMEPSFLMGILIPRINPTILQLGQNSSSKSLGDGLPRIYKKSLINIKMNNTLIH
ncbi:unnamed protein product [Cunninghamella echinulata]